MALASDPLLDNQLIAGLRGEQGHFNVWIVTGLLTAKVADGDFAEKSGGAGVVAESERKAPENRCLANPVVTENEYKLGAVNRYDKK